MPQSDLERLAESIRALAGQVERDVPSLQERRRRINQLAARTARLAGPGDPALIRVIHLARLAADRLTDAIEHLVATAESGNDYANGLARRTGNGPTADAGSVDLSGSTSGDVDVGDARAPATGGGADGRSQSRRNRRDELRRALLDNGEDVSSVLAEIAEPVMGPPPETRIEGVDDPISAVVVGATVIWEAGVRWLRRLRGPRSD